MRNSSKNLPNVLSKESVRAETQNTQAKQVVQKPAKIAIAQDQSEEESAEESEASEEDVSQVDEVDCKQTSPKKRITGVVPKDLE